MNLSIRRTLINTTIVFISLGIAYFLIQFAGISLLKRKIVFSPWARQDKPAEGIWTQDDAKKFFTLESRTGELSRILISMNIDTRIKNEKSVITDRQLLFDLPGPVIPLSGRKISRGRNGLVPDLDDTFIIRGLLTGREKVRARYRTDSFGRRLTGTKREPNRKKNIIFLGCSFTYGFGVNDEATFPYRLREKTDLNVYNYGISGSSPSLTLKILRDLKSDFLGDLNQEDTTVVYTLIPEHLNRMVGTLLFFRHQPDSFTNQPFITEREEQLIIHNSFSEDPTYQKHVLKFLARIHLLKVFGVDLPELGKDHYELAAKILQEIERELKNSYPQIKSFHVAFYPSGGEMLSHYFSLRDTLLEKKMRVLDYSQININSLLGPHSTLAYDAHPSPLAYDVYSELLLHDLRKIIRF